MKMTMRWFGKGNDNIPLSYIKQIPGVEGVVWSLHDIPAGEEWPMDRILEVKEQVESYGLHMDVVESVNVHDDIKLGLMTRDQYINNYIKTIEKLAQAGVKVICYNFMPVFDWTRTDLFKEMEDGSTTLFFEQEKVANIDPHELVRTIALDSTFTMPGWEPERLGQLSSLFEKYKKVTEEDLWSNLQYFLEKVIPAAKENGIKMSIHPDDPPWSVFGLPRILVNKKSVQRFLKLVDDPCNGLTLCSGSFGADPQNDIPEMIHEFSERIHFAHVRNVKTYENGDFIETSHRANDGAVDIYKVMEAYHENGFTGYMRPDHGRHIWGEEGRPGYGLYDRGLGIMYMLGIWDTLSAKMNRKVSR